MPYGPQSHQWSTACTSIVAGSRARSLSPSSRPLNSSTSCGSRDSTCTSSIRDGYASLRSATASANITDPARRFPYSRVTVVSADPASSDAAMDIIGVIPDPAAISTWWPGTPSIGSERAARHLDVDHVARAQLVDEPAGHCAAGDLADPDPRRLPDSGADRVRPSLVADPDRQRLPGREGELGAKLWGTANVTAAESSVSDSTDCTASGWKVVRAEATSDLLDVLERFVARSTAVERLAGSPAEGGGEGGVASTAERAGDGPPGQCQGQRNGR